MIFMLYVSFVDGSKPSGIFGSMIFFAVLGFIFMGVSHFFFKRFYEEYITIDNDKIIYKGPKIDGQKEKMIQIPDIKEILWENESFASGPGSRNSIYLVDKNSNKHTLVKNKIAGFLSVNKVTLEKMSATFNIPIHKEKYVMSSDLKSRRKA